MNFAQLECFVSLAGTLNFMQTAEQLGLTQPAVSKQIKSIEDELGATLFNRTSRSVSLTPIGQQFIPDATDMLKIYYRSKEWISSYYTNQRNVLRIGYSDPHQLQIISYFLRTLIKNDENSNITPEFINDQTDANLSRLQKSQLDIVIGMKDARFEDNQIVFRKLQDNGFKCVVAKSHPISKKFVEDENIPRTITSKELWPHRQIINIPPYLLKSYYSRGYRILPINDNLDNIICNNTNEAYGMALAGLGYTMVPEHLLIPHEALIVLDWNDSPHSSFGIYYDGEVDKKSSTYEFVKAAIAYYNNTTSPK